MGRYESTTGSVFQRRGRDRVAPDGSRDRAGTPDGRGRRRRREVSLMYAGRCFVLADDEWLYIDQTTENLCGRTLNTYANGAAFR